jgi:hypothetical protein
MLLRLNSAGIVVHRVAGVSFGFGGRDAVGCNQLQVCEVLLRSPSGCSAFDERIVTPIWELVGRFETQSTVW